MIKAKHKNMFYIESVRKRTISFNVKSLIIADFKLNGVIEHWRQLKKCEPSVT